MESGTSQTALEMAKKYDVLIAEDNPYGDIRFSGEPVPEIKSMDDEGRVIYMGSFSKVLFAGLRVGYTVSSKEIADYFEILNRVWIYSPMSLRSCKLRDI